MSNRQKLFNLAEELRMQDYDRIGDEIEMIAEYGNTDQVVLLIKLLKL